MGRILGRGHAGSYWELHLVFQNVSGELKEREQYLWSDLFSCPIEIFESIKILFHVRLFRHFLDPFYHYPIIYYTEAFLQIMASPQVTLGENEVVGVGVQSS